MAETEREGEGGWEGMLREEREGGKQGEKEGRKLVGVRNKLSMTQVCTHT